MALSAVSRYVAAQQAHGPAYPTDLRPDLVLRYEPACSDATWWLVEAKTSTTGKTRSVLMRRALHDLFAYRWAYDTKLQGQDTWGLGIVWGTGLAAGKHDARVCTPDLLPAVTAALMP